MQKRARERSKSDGCSASLTVSPTASGLVGHAKSSRPPWELLCAAVRMGHLSCAL